MPVDVVAAVITYLRPLLPAGLYIGTTVPNPVLTRMVTVRRDGGPRVDQVQEVARLGVNVWAESEYALLNGTDGLAQLVRAHLLGAAGSGAISGVDEISGPSVIPEASEQAHVYMTFEVVASGVDLP